MVAYPSALAMGATPWLVMTDFDDADIYEIEVENASGRHPARILVAEAGDGVLVRLEHGDRSWDCFSDLGAFEAFKVIRRDMESQKAGLPVCFGASEQVGQSAMQSQMGPGIKIYRLTIGQPARLVDLVDAFESGPDTTPVSVDCQVAFYDRWLASLL